MPVFLKRQAKKLIFISNVNIDTSYIYRCARLSINHRKGFFTQRNRIGGKDDARRTETLNPIDKITIRID
jgi:hypothetical protein